MQNFSNEQLNLMLDKIENPAMRSLFEMMMNQRQEVKQENNYQGITREKAINDVKLCLEKIKNLKEDVLELHNRLNEMLNFQTTIAGALGACHCFGENPNCESCFGKGIPGNYVINETAFQKYVYPFIQKLTNNVEKENTEERKDIYDISASGNKNGKNGIPGNIKKQ